MLILLGKRTAAPASVLPDSHTSKIDLPPPMWMDAMRAILSPGRRTSIGNSSEMSEKLDASVGTSTHLRCAIQPYRCSQLSVDDPTGHDFQDAPREKPSPCARAVPTVGGPPGALMVPGVESQIVRSRS